MANLPKYTLIHDDKKDSWALEQDGSGRVVTHCETKEDATEGGVLRRALGSEGGSVKIQKMNGEYQEERTFPRSADPKRSKG